MTQTVRRPEEIGLVVSSALGVSIDLVVENYTDPVLSRRRSRHVLSRLMRRTHNAGREDAAGLKMPHPRYSLSHCLTTVVAVANRLTHAIGIGVDIEYGRMMNPGAAKFFMTEREQQIMSQGNHAGSDLLRLWTVKEAVFKADLDNHCNFWFFDYETQDVQAWTGIASKVNSYERRRFRYTSVPYRDGFLTIAIAMRP